MQTRQQSAQGAQAETHAKAKGSSRAIVRQERGHMHGKEGDDMGSVSAALSNIRSRTPAIVMSSTAETASARHEGTEQAWQSAERGRLT